MRMSSMHSLMMTRNGMTGMVMDMEIILPAQHQTHVQIKQVHPLSEFSTMQTKHGMDVLIVTLIIMKTIRINVHSNLEIAGLTDSPV